MKKRICPALALLVALCLCQGVLAETDLSDYSLSSGVVSAVRTVYVTAPFSGTLEAFDLSAGDTVAAGDVLFRMLTTTLTAPEGGTVGAVFAAPGDNAAAVMARYGGLAAIQPAQAYRVQATVSGAYGKARNRELRAGEPLWARTNDGEERQDGSGRVILVQGSAYVMELTAGELSTGRTVALFRSAGLDAADRVGTGQVVFRDPVLLQGSGVVAEVLAKEGAAVQAGDPLMVLMGPDADRAASPMVTSPEAGVVTAVAVQPGQQVWKGAVLARIDLTDEMEILAEVDEVDLARLRVGDTLPVTLDMYPGQVFYGHVTEMSGAGVTRQNAAYFTVHVSMSAPGLRLGASASVYVPREP